MLVIGYPTKHPNHRDETTLRRHVGDTGCHSNRYRYLAKQFLIGQCTPVVLAKRKEKKH